MAMLRAFSTRRDRGGYERLLDDSATTSANSEAQLKRARSVPARVFGLSKRFTHQLNALPENSQATKPPPPPATKKFTKSHPLFSLFDGRSKKKTTAKPEFARYLQYLKEGGTWDTNANMPVIYYK